jgi:pyrimidine-nucleoside phosphorylase
VIDLSVGLELKKKVGDYVEKGETLAVLHANEQEKAEQAEERFLRAYRFSETQTPKRSMIFGEI